MPISPQKSLSPAELAKLEHAFATDPTSEAYRPLAEAYLGMGRFMEAMVVCKKGVKAHPTTPDPRLLLARVYAEQGKDKKALEELASALQVAPADKVVLRMTGSLQLKSGEAEAGKANLLKAHEVDPNDTETQAALSQWKVEIPKPKPPDPPTERIQVGPGTPAAGVPTAGPGTRRSGNTGPRPAAQPLGEGAVRPSGAYRAANGAQTRGQAPATGASGQRPMLTPAYEPHDDEDDDASTTRRRPVSKKSSSVTRFFFVILLLAVPIGLGTYYFIGKHNAETANGVHKALNAATDQLRHDSYESYQKACAAAEKAIELDPDSFDAHSYLAYAWAIRWGEHGGGDTARKNAEEHLEAALRAHKDSSYLYAAEALIKDYSGKRAEASRELEEKIKSFDAIGKQSSLMYLTLGILQMNSGDLERARESLEKSQAIAPDDPRIYSALGSLYRRRGQDPLAWKNYDFALRYEKDHPESLLGKSLLMLTQDDEKSEYYGVAAKMLKKLTDADPPPSPRQLAAAQLVRALLISRVSMDLPRYKPEYQKEISDGSGVPMDRARAQSDMVKAEETGFTLDRQDPELYLIKGRRLLFEGNFDGATTQIREAIKLDPTRAQSYMELARTLLKKPGGEKEARDALVTALHAMGESPKLLVMLGEAYVKTGQLDEALSQFNRAVSDPKAKNPEARLGMGRVYREKKDWPHSLEALEKAEKEFVGQSLRVAEVDTEFGRVYEDKGDRPKAEQYYEKALAGDPDFPDEYYWDAHFFSATDKAKAKTRAQQYLQLAPRGEHAADATRIASGQ